MQPSSSLTCTALYCCVQISTLSADKEEIERIAKELNARETRLAEDKQVCHVQEMMCAQL